jgi:hypothetical protein
MSREPREGFRESAAELELLLWALWNPIGMNVPLDEYRQYAPQIWKLLAEHADTDAVADELERIGREWMELDRIGDPRRAAAGDVREVAERLGDWWYWRSDFPREFAGEEGTA